MRRTFAYAAMTKDEWNAADGHLSTVSDAGINMNEKDHPFSIPQEGPLRKHQNLVILFWSISIVFALIQTWNSRHTCNPDGISYLEIAAAVKSGLWRETINVYWNPLYPCICHGPGMFTGTISPDKRYVCNHNGNPAPSV